MDGPTKEAINKFIASNGIPGVMPTMEMFEDAGMIALVHAINHCGGVMRACKVMKLLMLLPKSKNGVMTVTRPGAMFGQKKVVDKVTLNDEMNRRIKKIRDSSEYKKRKASHDLGKDLFVEDAVRWIKENPKPEDPAVVAAAAAKVAAPPPPPLKIAKAWEKRALINPCVAYAGGTDWENLGKLDKRISDPEGFALSLLAEPHLFTCLNNLKVTVLACGPSAAHCIALTQSGDTYAWGRNACGQLGVGDVYWRALATKVVNDSGSPIVAASCGKDHTVFILEDETVLGCGSHEKGALGRLHNNTTKPQKIPGLPNCATVCCGAEYTLVISEDNDLFSFGWSEFGVLGHGSDGSYNTSASSVKMTFSIERDPAIVATLRDHKVVQVACGPKHCAALAEDGSVFTWGCGDYGLLGHNEQRSLYKPTKLEGIVAMFITCGGQFSAALGWPAQRYSPAPNSAQLFMWGKVPKGSSSEAWMYPKQEAELAGWEIDSVDCGNSSTVVAAGGTCIAWGGGVMHRELGLGRDAAKTACRPSKVPAMEGVDVAQVCAGVGHTLWLVESDQVTAGFPVWEPTELTLEEHKMAEAERIAKEAAKAAEQPAKKKQKTGAK